MSGEILWLLAIGVFFFFMMRGGGCCGGHDHSGHGHGGHDDHTGGGGHDHDMHAHREADDSGRADHFTADSGASRDPVCGMTVAGGTDSPTSEHGGQTFNFCSEQCRKLFDLNPGKYVQSTN